MECKHYYPLYILTTINKITRIYLSNKLNQLNQSIKSNVGPSYCNPPYTIYRMRSKSMKEFIPNYSEENKSSSTHA